jgi:predicted phage tail protein
MPNDWPNTARSKTTVRLLEVISEGEIVGLVNGANSIYFNNTPIANPDGSVNFRGVSWDFHTGLPDQPHFVGNPTSETPFAVGVKVQKSVGPVIRTIADRNATSVRVIITAPALWSRTLDGVMYPFSVSWKVEVRSAGGTWALAQQHDIINQKFVSPVQFQDDVELPVGGYPWEIRVTRISDDFRDNPYFQSDIYWDTYVEIVAAKLSYPNTAVCSIKVDSATFGQTSVPTRTYKVKGMIIDVPNNYNPETRTYSGIWNGTFKRAWTNNPAWIFRDLIVNDRYGLGEFLTSDMVDKWSLYQIAQYCDQLVPDGYGGMEPRYTFNAQITNRAEAFKHLQTIVATFRGMSFWSMSQVFASADMPEDPIKLYSQANVINGFFDYEGTAEKSRHSVALVTWYDPQDFYRAAIEVVIDDEMLKKVGWRELVLDAKGCTTRSLAHRYGKWAIDTEKNATETVQFSASWDSADLRPGNVIAIADARKAQVRGGGRIVGVSGSTITLDGPFEPGAGETYNLLVEVPSGQVDSRSVFSIDGNIVHLTAAFNPQPQVGAMWAITGTDLAPRQYRVLSKIEKEENIFQITALYHDITKYARIEEGILFDPPPYYRLPDTIKPPTNLVLQENIYRENGVPGNRLLMSWTPADDFLAVSYHISAQSPSGFIDYGNVNSSSYTIERPQLGDWEIHVAAVSATGVESVPLVGTITIRGWESSDLLPYVSHLEIFGRGGEPTFGGKDCIVIWSNNFPGTSADYGNENFGAGSGAPNPFYRDNVVRIYDPDTNTLLRTEIVHTERFVYTFEHNAEDNAPYNRGPNRKFRIEVTVRDTLGHESTPAKLVCENPAPEIVIPNVSSSLSSVFVDYPRPSDLDFAGCIIWFQSTENFDPLNTTPSYDGPLNAVSFPANEQFSTYYVRLACYDSFNKQNLNISPIVPVDVGGVIIDTRPPAVPTGLTLTPYAETTADGTVVYAIRATWDASPNVEPLPGMPDEDIFGYFDVSIHRTGNNYVSFQTATSEYRWTNLIPNTLYYVRVRAFSRNGYPSGYSEEASTTTVPKTEPPGAPASLTAVASLRSVYLRWTNPSDPDLGGVEIWQGSNATFASASKVGSVLGHAFTHSGLTTLVPVYYWVRAFNTSGVFSSYVGPITITPGQVQEGDIAANSIVADHIVAGSITGNKLDVNTSLPATIVVGATGVQIGELTDPAQLINSNTTIIEPGKISISGDTTLANWRDGTDQTKIAGGAIQANTISANILTIGSRGVTISGLQFSYNSTNLLSWSAGNISYIADNGSSATVSVEAGSEQWTSGTLYVGWQKGAGVLSTGSQPFFSADFISMAAYRGGIDLVANYGRTIVDGSQIVTNSIQANQISAGAIQADKIAANAILASHISAGAVTADKISAGTINTTGAIFLGGNSFELSATNQRIVIQDTQAPPQTRIILGKIGATATDYGISIYDQTGALILSSGAGLNVPVAIGNGTITDSMIVGLSASKISAASLSAISANLGTVTAGIARDSDSKFVIDFTNGTLTISD